MNKKILLVLAVLFAGAIPSVNAHMGGHDPVSEKEAIFIASQVSKQFVNLDPGLGFGKLKKSWNEVSGKDQRIHKKGNGYYIVSVENKAEAKTLYILLSIEGEVYDANFTGQFKGLK